MRTQNYAGARAPSDLAFQLWPGLHDSNRTVAELVEEILKHWPGTWQDKTDPKAPHEAGLLQLSTDKAYALLRWFPVWTFSEAVAETIDWYRNSQQLTGARDFQKQTQAQIAQYTDRARSLRSPWAASP